MLTDVGQVVANKYELVRLIGRGAAGEVWAAHHKTLGEHVALKLLKPADALAEDAAAPGLANLAAESHRAAAARFLFEAQVAARLSRKTRHIVRVTDHGEEEGLAYIVMELLEGETLQQRLQRECCLPPAVALKIVAQIARALGQAHAEGVVHRDLKPANVFLTRDEEGGLLVKVLDFGIARATRAHRVESALSTGHGLVFGTPGYMSPEQARASPALDEQCDLWALATIAYEMLSGALPVPGADIDELLQNLCAGRMIPVRKQIPIAPESLVAFFDRAFAEHIPNRYPSAAELTSALERALSDWTGPPARTSRAAASTGTTQARDLVPSALSLRGRPTRQRWGVAVALGGLVATAAIVVTWRMVGGAVVSGTTGATTAGHSFRERPIAPASEVPAAADLTIPATTEGERPLPGPAPSPAPSPEPAVAVSSLPQMPVSSKPSVAFSTNGPTAPPAEHRKATMSLMSAVPPSTSAPPPSPETALTSSARLAPARPPQKPVDRSDVF